MMSDYIILSLKHGTGESPVFWRQNNCGYTKNPFMAGSYTREQVQAEPDYYNDGINTVAIPLHHEDFDLLSFKCSFDEKSLFNFLRSEKQLAKGIPIE